MYARTYDEAFPPKRGASRLRELARGITLSILGSIPWHRPVPSLRLLYCHYVFDDQVARFDAVLRLLCSMGTFVDTATVIRVVKGNLPVNQDMFHLSFDDGFKNIISNALPVLRHYDIPAVFFVPTRLIMGAAGTGSIGQASPWTENIEMATWNDLEKAASIGFEIGSHTRTHARFSDISRSASAIENEIFGSKDDLERRLGSCRYISWPYGRISDADVQTLEAVERAGYDGCFGAFRSRVYPGVTNRFRIPRHHFESNWPLSHIKYFAMGGMESRAI